MSIHAANPSGVDGGTLLDPSRNHFPEGVRTIHIMGICGTGMAALAGMLQEAGYTVRGSDQQVYPPMSDFLARRKIPVHEGYDPANLEPHPDVVVVGNVITRKNPEAIALAQAEIPYVSFPQALAHIFLRHRTSLVVTGTHGKTTTSSLLATLLEEAELSPGFLIGGLVEAFSTNARAGSGDYFVVEGDEYDTAFFDKGPKFLHYLPKIAIITSIEFDHADIYDDLAAVKHSFRRLVASMPADGILVAHLDDQVVAEIVADAPCTVEGYGQTPGQDWALAEVSVQPAGTSFTVLHQGEIYGHFTSVLPGRHNALNTLAVIAVLHRLGVSPEIAAAGLGNFPGVKRRQEVRGTVGGITVIDDFAHHPTAVRETLAALAAAYAGRRLVAVFEPRTNSSRRRVFQDTYATVFDQAEHILIKEPPPITTLSEEQRFSARQLTDDLTAKGLDARYFPSTEEILAYLAESSRPGDVIAIMSNGGFDNIHARLLDILTAASTPVKD